MMRDKASLPPVQCNVDDSGALACPLASDAALLAAGWERRFIAEPQRAEEMAQVYRDLGFAVRLEPVRLLNVKDECAGCREVFESYLAVYTRKEATAT